MFIFNFMQKGIDAFEAKIIRKINLKNSKKIFQTAGLSLAITTVILPWRATAVVENRSLSDQFKKPTQEISNSNLKSNLAPKVSSPSHLRSSHTILVAATKEALAMPLEKRIPALSEQGPQGYRNLVQIMFDEKASMEARWRAVTSVGAIGGVESIPEIERALKKNEWYMRSAGLVAMSNVNRKSAIYWARKLLSDKALVVRAAAVETLAELKDTEASSVLWQKLYAKENFKNGQSLFVRKRIVETLAQLNQSGSESKFIEVLGDKDKSLHPSAILALERMTQIRFSDLGSIPLQRERWQAWWKDKTKSANL